MTVGQAIAGVLALVMPAYDSAFLAAAVLTAALLFTLLLVARQSAPVAAPLLARAASVRDRAEQTVFLRQCDPDAAGRPRPRAPGR
jgi:multisubunit Na+/H+ antiporter MnhG subunit